MNSNAFLRVENLRKEFRKKGGVIEVLKGISFTLERGETLAVVGVSGAGKTTLLQIVGTLDKATSGSVLFDGQDVTSMPDGELAGFRNRKVGFVFQFHHLLPEFDARENVMLPCLIAGMGREAARKKAEDLLSAVGLGERFTHRIGELSGGELQRVAICRALAMGPEILLADEPTGNLDRETASGIAELLGTLNRTMNLSLVVVTHNIELAERMHRILKIDDGRIVR